MAVLFLHSDSQSVLGGQREEVKPLKAGTESICAGVRALISRGAGAPALPPSNHSGPTRREGKRWDGSLAGQQMTRERLGGL